MRRNQNAAATGAVAGFLAASLVGSGAPLAHINTEIWSLSGHQLSTTSNANSNMVGFWQTLGVGMIDCVNGVYDTRTVNFTKRMQAEIANPPQPQTGVVNAVTWNAVYVSQVPGGPGSPSIPRLTRINGSAGSNGYFEYYNGYEVGFLYWQGTNTGTGLWKFRPYSAPNYIEATTARTMGSYNRPGASC